MKKQDYMFVYLIIISLLISNRGVWAQECRSPRVCESINWNFLGKADAAKAGSIKQKADQQAALIPEDLYAPDDGERHIHAWVDARVQEAKEGHASVVRISIVMNAGWGCTVPAPFCLETSGGGCVYIKPTGNSQLLTNNHSYYFNSSYLPAEKRDDLLATRYLAEGYFVGKKKSLCNNLVEDEAGCCANDDAEYEFHILRVSDSPMGSSFHFQTQLPGGSSKPEGQMMTSGSKWGVLNAGFPMTDAAARLRASKLKSQLIEKGFGKTTLVDSRLIPKLWCCFDVVLVDRLATKEEAVLLQKKIAVLGIKNFSVVELY